MTAKQWRCTYCGATNESDDKFCGRCGVIGIKAPVKGGSTVVLGWIFIALFAIVGLYTVLTFL